MKNALNLGKSFDFYAVLNFVFDGAIVFCDHKEPGSSQYLTLYYIIKCYVELTFFADLNFSNCWLNVTVKMA